jgi:hypothetical protein
MSRVTALGNPDVGGVAAALLGDCATVGQRAIGISRCPVELDDRPAQNGQLRQGPTVRHGGARSCAGVRVGSVLGATQVSRVTEKRYAGGSHVASS